jgi:hypothetical protein
MTCYMVSMVSEYQHPFRALEAVMERMLSPDNQDQQMSWADDTSRNNSRELSVILACRRARVVHASYILLE